MHITFTTTNKHKLKSAAAVLNTYGIEVVGKEVAVDEIQSDSPEEVVLDKVKKSFEQLKEPVVAMDSGLFIEPLNGFPGVYTKSVIHAIGEDGLMKLTKDIPRCTAYVQRVIAYYDGVQIKTFFSRGYGEIIQEKRGDNGINYDLIFYVPEKSKTLAQLTYEEQIVVWGDAWGQLAQWLQSDGLKNNTL